MKRGTASRVVIGGNTMLDLPKGLVFGTDVILGGIAGLTSDFNGLVLSNTLMLGKKISHISVITVIVRGQSPLNLPYAIADSLHYVKAFGGTEQRNLPDGYIERQFIYMMDGSYLLTDIVPTYDGRVEMDFQTTSIQSGATSYLGGRSESYPAGLRLGTGSGNSRIVVTAFSNSAYTAPTDVENNTRYKFTFNNKVATLESGGSTLFTNTFTGENANGAALVINGLNSAGTITPNAEGIYLYSFKVWNGQGELVADYIPAVQKGTVPVVGFYDTVSKTFKTATAGTFAAGGEAVPTPDTPMDIVSNNGVLKVSPNLFDKDASYALFDGYVTNKSVGQSTTLNAHAGGDKTIIIKVAPDTTYTVTRATNLGSVYDRIRCAAFKTLPSGGSTGVILYNDRNTTQANATFTTLSDTQYVAINVRNSGEVGNDWTQFVDAFQLEQGSQATPYMPYGQIYADGTVETIEDTIGNTATAEMLLKVGNYQDVQSILDGVVTRNVGVKVLDGTENIGKSGTYSGSFFVRSVVSDWGTSNNAQVYCSHFSGVTADTDYVQNKCMILNNAFNMWWASDSTPTVAQFQQWLADQYAAGTPVIICYQLATATTESVTGQTLQVQKGNNILEITQASMNGLELEASYDTGVVAIIQEVQDVNLNNNVTVTIE